MIKPKPQESFTKYQRRCPFHVKARCGRAFCNHEYNKSKTKICNKWSCIFYKESEELMGKKRNVKSEYPINKRYRSVIR